MKYDLTKLQTQLSKIKKTSDEIKLNENISKYGTFLDSKKDIVQLYILFMFFGINMDTINLFPATMEPFSDMYLLIMED